MNNFDLKKFLIENKLTSNSRMLKEEDVLLNYVGNNDTLKGKEVKVISSEPDGAFVKAADGSKDFVDWAEIETLDGQKVTLDTLDQISQNAKQQSKDTAKRKQREREEEEARRAAEREEDEARRSAERKKAWEAGREEREKAWEAGREEREKAQQKLIDQGARRYTELEDDTDAIYDKIAKVSSNSASESYPTPDDPEPYPERGTVNAAREAVKSRESIEEFINDYGDPNDMFRDIVEQVNDEDLMLESDFDVFDEVYNILTPGTMGGSVGDYLRETGWEEAEYEEKDLENESTVIFTKGEETMTIEYVWDTYFAFIETAFREDLSYTWLDDILG